MKECPLCGFKHNKKNATYCNRVITKNCLGCGEEFSYKCRKANGVKKYCSQKCAHTKRAKEKKCEICGDPAIEKYCRAKKTRKCAYCKKEYEYECKKGASIYCSISCSVKNPEVTARRNATQIERYGALGFNTQKQKDTMIERYGHAVPAKNEKVKEKIRQTQYKKNGGKFAFNTEKQKQTMVERYGGHGILSDPEKFEQHKATMKQMYGVEFPSQDPYFANKAMESIIENHGHLFSKGVISKLNTEAAQKIEDELGVTVEYEKLVDGKFFDLYLPDFNIYIDINPTITHNSDKAFACLRNKCEDGCTEHEPTSESYHYERAMLAKEKGFKLIQIYEWESFDDLIKLIYHKTSQTKNKISGHSCEAKKIEQSEANKFLKEYHVQGAARKQEHCYGLYYKDELVAVSTFSPSRFKSKYEWEFMRYAVKKDYHIYGASKKLFNMFIEEVSPNSIISYIDFNHTTTDTFMSSLDFKEIDPTGPREVWSKKGSDKSYPITSLLAIGADRLLGTSYGSREESGLDNRDIMWLEGFNRVFTAGNRVFLWEQK